MTFKVAIATCVLGTAFAAFVALRDYGGSNSWVPIALILGPWLLFDALLLFWRSALGLVLAGALMMLVELYMYYGVFVSPGSSTDALAYISKPVLQLLICVPIGLFVGWVIDKRIAPRKR